MVKAPVTQTAQHPLQQVLGRTRLAYKGVVSSMVRIVKVPFGVLDPPGIDQIAIQGRVVNDRLTLCRDKEPERPFGLGVKESREVDDVPDILQDDAIQAVLLEFCLEAFGEAAFCELSRHCH